MGLFDEVCDKFNISVPATTGGNESSDGSTSDVRAEKWTMDNGGSYGGGGGGGGSWRSAAGSSVAIESLLGWTFSGVAISLGLLF
jgi:hypothetical protein